MFNEIFFFNRSSKVGCKSILSDRTTLLTKFLQLLTFRLNFILSDYFCKVSETISMLVFFQCLFTVDLTHVLASDSVLFTPY